MAGGTRHLVSLFFYNGFVMLQLSCSLLHLVPTPSYGMTCWAPIPLHLQQRECLPHSREQRRHRGCEELFCQRLPDNSRMVHELRSHLSQCQLLMVWFPPPSCRETDQFAVRGQNIWTAAHLNWGRGSPRMALAHWSMHSEIAGRQ